MYVTRLHNASLDSRNPSPLARQPAEHCIGLQRNLCAVAAAVEKSPNII
jgi:hypothetical protein